MDGGNDELHNAESFVAGFKGLSPETFVSRALAAIRDGGCANDVAPPQTEGVGDPRSLLSPAACIIALETRIERACQEAGRAVLEDADDDRKKRWNAVLAALYYAHSALRTVLACGRLIDSAETAGADEGMGADDEGIATSIARFSAIDLNATNQVQRLILYLLNCAQLRGYRRHCGACYQRLYTQDGHDTHAWAFASTMQDFVYSVTKKEINFDMWCYMTSTRANVTTVVEHLSACHDSQLPDLKKDRHVFSFRNGIYLAAADKFVRYGTAAAASLSPDLVAAKFFDTEFPIRVVGTRRSGRGGSRREEDEDREDAQGGGGLRVGDGDGGDGDGGEEDGGDDAAAAGDWFASVPTPHLQSILDFQEMSTEVSRWMYVMIGRLIYAVNELDQWQVIPYLKGAASSGKSTIVMRVCRGLYEPTDVGVVSNNIERKFGLSALYDKLLFVGPEIKSDVGLEQAEFQSIVSGEAMQVAVKFQTARAVDWTVPGILAGNEVPGWVDNSGSINRRIVLFEFNKRVQNADMELGKKLDAEMGAIVLKANRGYRWAVSNFARENLWVHLPAEFHRAKESFNENVNSLVHFLRSGVVRFDRTAYMPLPKFIAEYKKYVHDMGLRALDRLTGDPLEQPLASQGCVLSKGGARHVRRWPRTGTDFELLDCKMVLGLDLACYFQDPDGAEEPGRKDD